MSRKARKKFQRQNAKKLSKPGGKSSERLEWDRVVPGLCLRARAGHQPIWRLQIRIHGRTMRRSLGLAASMSVEEARETAHTLVEELRAGRAPEPVPQLRKRMTVRECGERFLGHGAVSWKPATLKAHRHNLQKIIVPRFGSTDISLVTAEEVASWRSEIDASAGTRNRALAVLSGVMRHAEILGVRPPGSNPCQGLRRRKNSFKAHQLTPDDYRRLGAALRKSEKSEPVVVALVRFLALTGCRKSEARLLRWEMIDGCRAALPDSKTGPRAIWMGERARTIIAELPRTSPFVFSIGDEAVPEHQLDKNWRAIRSMAGMPTLRLHDLRHGFASVAISSGESLRTVSGLLGHSDLQTTAGYAKFSEEPVRKAAERVADHLTKALRGTRAA
jgi:integrase